MMGVSLYSFLIIACLFFVTSEGIQVSERKERSSGSHWGYEPQNGPHTWEGMCQTGKRQSPINIQLGSVKLKNFPPFSFDEDYLSKLKFFAKNNGHTIYVAVENSTSRPVISEGGMGGKYIFEQLHFHWESEHELEGKRADLEMHLVHYNSKYEEFSEAATKSDGLVVLAVLFDESEETDRVLEDFFEYILDVSSVEVAGHSPVEISDNSLQKYNRRQRHSQDLFALRNLLPRHVYQFFRYDGSLTTPGCGEVVQWTVFINRLPVSRRVLDSFRTIRDHDNQLITKNFRPPQKLNGREVYMQIDKYKSGGSNNVVNINTVGSIYLCYVSLTYVNKF